MNANNATMLISAALVAGGLFYLGWQLGQTAGAASAVTDSPLGRIVLGAGARR